MKNVKDIKIYCHHVNCGQISLSFSQSERDEQFTGILTNPKKKKKGKTIKTRNMLIEKPEITVNKTI